MTTDIKFAEKDFSWVFLGPLSALMSVTLIYIKVPNDFFPLFMATVVGMALTWVLRLKGLILAFVQLILFSFLIWNAPVSLLWSLGALCTVGFSFILTFLTLEQAEGKILGWEEHLNTHIETKRELEEQIDKAEKEFYTLEKIQELSRIEILSALAEKETLKEELNRIVHAKRKLEEEFEDQNHRIEGYRQFIEKLQAEALLNQELKEHIDTLSREKELLESTLSRLQGELDNLPPIIEILPDSDADVRRLTGMYKQLREQFNEKNRLLEDTRKELFLETEKALVLEKELFELESKILHETSAQFTQLFEQNEEAKQEITKLHALIDSTK